MNSEFAAATTAHSTKDLSDFDLAMKIIGKMVPDAPKPDFVTIASCLALHEMIHSGEEGEDARNFIYEQDIVGDRRRDCDDTREVFGFRDDADGREALQIMAGWVSLGGVWKRSADGTYQLFDMAALGDNLHAIDVNDPSKLRAVVQRACNQAGVSFFPRKPLAVALEEM